MCSKARCKARSEPGPRQRATGRRRFRRAFVGRPIRGRSGRYYSTCKIKSLRDSPNALGYELVRAEAARGARSKNPDAMDLAMRGRALLARQPPTKDDNRAARAFFEQALQIDPNDPDALAGSAATYAADFRYGWTSSGTDYEAKIIGPSRSGDLARSRRNIRFPTKGQLSCSDRSNGATRWASLMQGSRSIQTSPHCTRREG